MALEDRETVMLDCPFSTSYRFRILLFTDFNAGRLGLLGNIFEFTAPSHLAPAHFTVKTTSDCWTHFAEFSSELFDLLTCLRKGARAINFLRRMT